MSWLSRLKAARGGAQALSAQAEHTLRTWHALPDAVLDPAPGEALAGLLGVVGKSPLVVFNASFNRSMLERALNEHLGLVPSFVWIDLYFLLPSLFPEKRDRPGRLADWMAAFGIETFQRHHALGDAWAIAQLFLAAQARALSFSVTTPAGLAEHQVAFRQKLKV